MTWSFVQADNPVPMQLTEILALRKEDEFLREQLRTMETQKYEAESALDAVRLEAASKRAEQERCNRLNLFLLSICLYKAVQAFDKIPCRLATQKAL